MADKVPPSPSGMKAAGRRLWRSTVNEFVLEQHEIELLREACRALDALDALQSFVDTDGVLDETPQGRRAHPALVELRAQRICFARLVAQLGLPTGEQDAEPVKGQRRATRGVYGITGAVS